jgi:hypothetical protein
MLQVVAPYVAEMLHLKTLTINVVAGVAGFQSMSTCKPHIKSLAINVLALFFAGFLCPTSCPPHSLGGEGGWRVEGAVIGQRSKEWRTRQPAAHDAVKPCQTASNHFSRYRGLLPDFGGSRPIHLWPFSTKVGVGRSK